MAKTRKPTVISAFLLSGTVALAGGAVALAAHPVVDMMSNDRSDVVEAPVALAADERLPAGPPPVLAGLAQSAARGGTSRPGSADGLDRAGASAGGGGNGRNAESDVRGERGRAARKDPPPAGTTAQAAPSGTVTYVVEDGDTLAGIAAWFDQQGYGDLYQANKAVIGANPDLILPGQRFTISRGTLTMGAGG